MFSEAVNHYQAGRLDAARAVCCSILAQQAGHAHALHLTGVIAMQQGDLNEAERLIRRALEASPEEVNFYNTLGILLRRQGNMKKAQACFEQCLRLAPKDAEVIFNLANLLKEQGELKQAGQLYRQVLSWQPQHLNARLSLAFLLRRQGDLCEAESCFREGLLQGGMAPRFLLGLGLVLSEQHRNEEAEQCFRQVLLIQPLDADANFHLGNALYTRGLVSEAEVHHRQCLELKPDYPIVWNNLGNDLRDQGRLDEARDAYRKALQLKPDYMRAHSNLLFSLPYDLADSKSVYEEHLRWGDMHAACLMPSSQDSKYDYDSERKLRIGYVSPDFKEHSVAYFIEPILAVCDHSCFEVYCFSDIDRPDTVTERLKGHVDQWLDISTCSDDAVADMIKQERIDILVDLAGHTSRHRLLVFARKPAPIQVTYLGYPATTGMQAMDYRLSDELADPVGSDTFYSEDLIRLPTSFLCYAPPAAAPDVSPLPCLENGFVSFGSFNHLSKVTNAVISAWSKILLRLSGSKMVLKHISLQDPSNRDRYLRLFEACGVDRGRITLLSWSDSVRDHLACYSAVDIALDTFPYNGTTTTCESLWMGVPVITVAGQDHVSRVGLSLLKNAGLEDLVTGDVHGYIEKTINLAKDTNQLAAMRSKLRHRISNSRLCDQQAIAIALGQAYRNIWQHYCAEQHTGQAQ